MDYEQKFADALAVVKQEGRYREFADIRRQRGSFPTADHYRPDSKRQIKVWCSNDYLCMEFVEHRLGDDVEDAEFHRADPAFFRQLVEGVVAGQSRIDPLLNDCLSEGWRLARIDSILRATLRAAAFEMLERSEVPARVVITEYVDVAHAFLDGDDPKVVNGILDRLARMLRQGELGEAASA